MLTASLIGKAQATKRVDREKMAARGTTGAGDRERDAVAALLEWYLAMGVDVTLAEAPQDRFAETSRGGGFPMERQDGEERGREDHPGARQRRSASMPSAAPPRAPAITGQAPMPTQESVLAAREQAAAAGSLEELRDRLDRFEGCALRKTAKTLVFADGNPRARLMLVGEAPGREEDLQGLPFVGRSGQLLDRMLAAIGLDRNAVYIANVVPWRPPGNRTPTPTETEICRPFIERQIELVAPEILVCLGAAAARQLLHTSEGILRLRGKWLSHRAGEAEIAAMATLHPAYLLRQPAQKRLAWRDFREISRKLQGS